MPSILNYSKYLITRNTICDNLVGFPKSGQIIIMEYLMYIAAVHGHIVLVEIDCLENHALYYSKLIVLYH